MRYLHLRREKPYYISCIYFSSRFLPISFIIIYLQTLDIFLSANSLNSITTYEPPTSPNSQTPKNCATKVYQQSLADLLISPQPREEACCSQSRLFPLLRERHLRAREMQAVSHSLKALVFKALAGKCALRFGSVCVICS